MTDPNTIEYLEEILHEVHGWLGIDEAELLYNLARDAKGSVIEIGSYHGRSTIALAKGIQARGITPPVDYVYAIDPHNNHDVGEFHFDMGDNTSFMFNMWGNSVVDTVRVINVPSEHAMDMRTYWNWLHYELVFIDGCHDYGNVLADFEAFAYHLSRNGKIAIHDSTGGWEGPTRVVKEAIESGAWELVTQVGYTSVLRRAKGD